MWDEDGIEINAVERIKKYFADNPQVRSLSARHRHTLKFQLKEKIRRWNGHFPSPETVPDENLNIARLVEDTRNRPVMA